MGKGTGKELPPAFANKVVQRLVALGGVPRRHAEAMAEWLQPTIESLVKAELKKFATHTVEKTMRKVTAKAAVSEAPQTQPEPLGATNASGEGSGVGQAIEIDGLRLRVDLPVVSFKGGTGLELLRVMHGLSSTASYLVAAVKGEAGIVAIRQYSQNDLNVKFYPNMAYWGVTPGDLSAMLNGEGVLYGTHLRREHYERMHMTPAGVEQLLFRLETEAKPRSRMKKLMDRLLAVTYRPLAKAFDVLYARTYV